MDKDMECLSKLDENQKIAFMRALARVANADGKLNEEEKEFIKNIAIIYGIEESRISKSLFNCSDEDIIRDVKSITDRKASLELIKEMCMLAHVDAELSTNETLLIGKIGQSMGVSLEKIEQISNWVIDRIIWLEEAKIIFEEA